LLELKLAAASALTYEEFWGNVSFVYIFYTVSLTSLRLFNFRLKAMFGEGKIENFEEILDTKLSPFLSSV
jgi:betaine lipid synthase